MRKMPLCMFSLMRLSLIFGAPMRINDIAFFHFAIDVPSSLPLLHFFWSRRHTKSCSCSNKNSFVRLRDQKVVDEGLSFASIAQPKKQKWHFWMKRKRSSSRWNCKKNETTSKAYSQSIDLKPFVGGNTLTCLLVLVSQRLALSYSPNHLSIEWSDEKFAHEVPNAFIDVGNR